MCYLKEINRAGSMNEIQRIIVKAVVSQKENFTYQFIFKKIKDELEDLGLPESIADSYRIDNMISETLEQMLEKGNISYFNNVYIPSRSPVKRVRAAFA